MTHEEKRADIRKFIEAAHNLSDDDRYKVLMMIQGIIFIRASEIGNPHKTA